MNPQKILIVDDENLIQITTSILLKKNGFTVYNAMNGKFGLDVAEKELPDLILLDIMMPGMDGWEVVDELRKNHETASIPIIIFTAGDFVEAEKKAKELKVKGIIRKPFFLDQMLEVINRKDDGANDD